VEEIHATLCGARISQPSSSWLRGVDQRILRHPAMLRLKSPKDRGETSLRGLNHIHGLPPGFLGLEEAGSDMKLSTTQLVSGLGVNVTLTLS